MKKRLFKIFLFVTLILFSAYLVTVYVMPVFLNSKKIKRYIVHKIELKTNTKIIASSLKVKITPKLHLNFNFDEFDMYSGGEKLFDIEGLKCDLSPFNIKNNRIYIESFYIQKNNLLALKKNKKSLFKGDILTIFRGLPEIFIKQGVIELGERSALTSKFLINDLHLEGVLDKSLSLNLEVISSNLPEKVLISDKDKIYFTKENIYTENFVINFGNTKLYINGTLFSRNGNDFYINGDDILPSTFVKTSVLVYRALKQKKHFIENFKDFKGLADFNLHIKNGNIFGNLNVDYLSAYTVPLNVPMSFKNAYFIFDKRDVLMRSNGKMGGEDVVWNFFLTGIFTDNLTVSGNLSSFISNSFAVKYIDKLSIKDKIHLNIEYLVNNGVVDVFYTAKLPVGSDISYYGANLGLTDYERRFHAATKKTGDIISLVNYSYSKMTSNGDEKIIFGDGDFEKINGKYALVNLFGQTMKDAPISLLGFLDDRFVGGYFNGNIEYDFIKNKILGSIVLEKTRFKKFKIDNAAIFGDEKLLTILSSGTFRDEPFTCDIEIVNNLKKSSIDIKKLSLYLKKYVFQKKTGGKKQSFVKASGNMKKYPKINADNIEIRLDAFMKDKIVAQNMLLNGSVKNNVINFVIKSVQFAQGTLSAEGYADPSNSMIDATFGADNLNSNIAAYQLFNLKDQVAGSASGKLHLVMRDKLNDIKGEGSFQIKNGMLLKVGDKDAIEKASNKNHKHKKALLDAIKIRKSATMNPKSNISGTFKLDNAKLNDIYLYAQNDFISIYAEGEYDRKEEYANLKLWGKYDNDTAKKITLFHIPLTWLTKFAFKTIKLTPNHIEKFKNTPDVKAKNGDVTNFTAEFYGNINNTKKIDGKLLIVK